MDGLSSPLKDVFRKVQNRERLSAEDGLKLFRNYDLLLIGTMAHQVRERMHGRRAFHARNLHLNPTNICLTRCEFCAFSRDADSPDAYALTLDEIERKVREAVERSQINEVHIVGGHNPALGLDYYVEMLKRIRAITKDGDFFSSATRNAQRTTTKLKTNSLSVERSTLCEKMAVPFFIKAFSAPEVDFMAKNSGLSWAEVLRRLKEAGLDGMPGGGAEIFDPGVRAKICPKKISGEEWIEIHRAAHRIGIKTNATMLYGHVETDEQRVAHLLRLRELQDETQGFCAFVPLAYNSGGGQASQGLSQSLGTVPLESSNRTTAFTSARQAGTPAVSLRETNRQVSQSPTSGYLDLKVLSISRLLLDNIPHIKAHGSATDLKFVQVALSFGADDAGGTNLHEKVMREAGSHAPEGLSSDDLIRCIMDAGFEPCLVNSSYQINKGFYNHAG